jgi:hypothetical protein
MREAPHPPVAHGQVLEPCRLLVVALEDHREDEVQEEAHGQQVERKKVQRRQSPFRVRWLLHHPPKTMTRQSSDQLEALPHTCTESAPNLCEYAYVRVPMGSLASVWTVAVCGLTTMFGQLLIDTTISRLHTAS